jgi:hypothetical protein
MNISLALIVDHAVEVKEREEQWQTYFFPNNPGKELIVLSREVSAIFS